MAEDRDELLQHYRETREALLAAINGISDELMVELAGRLVGEGPPGPPGAVGRRAGE